MGRKLWATFLQAPQSKDQRSLWSDAVTKSRCWVLDFTSRPSITAISLTAAHLAESTKQEELGAAPALLIPHTLAVHWASADFLHWRNFTNRDKVLKKRKLISKSDTFQILLQWGYRFISSHNSGTCLFLVWVFFPSYRSSCKTFLSRRQWAGELKLTAENAVVLLAQKCSTHIHR